MHKAINTVSQVVLVSAQRFAAGPRRLRTTVVEHAKRRGEIRSLLALTCFTFTCLWLGTASAAACPPEHVLALLDKGFSKDEVRQLCAGEQAPAEPKQSPGPRPERRPAEAGRAGTAADQPPASMDWLQSVLPLGQTGQDGSWRAYTEGVTYVLENQKDFGTIGHGKKPEPGEEGRRHISVKVKVTGEIKEGKVVGAGLMYALDPKSDHYYAFVLEPDQSVRFYEYDRETDKFVQRGKISSDSIKKNGFNKLEIVEQGKTIKLFVNDSGQVLSFVLPGTGQGAVGIFAGGQGPFTFTDFTHAVN